MLNFIVYNQATPKLLVPWRTYTLSPPDITLCAFFHKEVTRFIQGGSHDSLQLEVHRTFVGSSKQWMDLVDGTTTTEVHRPLCAKSTGRPRNQNSSLCCQQCVPYDTMQRIQDLAPIVFTPRKLSSITTTHTHMYGATLDDLEILGSLSEVCIHDLQCYDPWEKLFYSMKCDLICIHCCSDNNIVSVQRCYPQSAYEGKSSKLCDLALKYFVPICTCIYMCSSGGSRSF